MTDQQAFDDLKKFFEEREVCTKAADPLGRSVEVSVVINKTLECAFHKEDNKPKFSLRPAVKPDVIFYMSHIAIENLVKDSSEDIGELGINIAKNYLAGNIKIRVVGSMINLLTNGYLGIIKSGGISFAKFLAGHGINGLGKIKDAIQNMRSKK